VYSIAVSAIVILVEEQRQKDCDRRLRISEIKGAISACDFFAPMKGKFPDNKLTNGHREFGVGG
jgi:hypothetical protein